MTPDAARTVCVVIAALDAERWLADAVRSALAQTHADLEVVVVDDGSRDGTLAVARALADRDPRVTVLTGPNGGRADARNRAVAAARPCGFLAFLDADDLWDADKLAAQLAWLDDHPAMLGVGCRMRYVSSTGRVLGETGEAIGPAELARIAGGALSPFPISSSLVVRRAAWDAHGGFDPVLREAEDLDFLARLARLGPIGTVPRVLGSYRIHPASAMARRRLVVNMYARFVRERLRRQDAGGDLAWPDFAAAYRPGWGERRRDLVELWYRSAALWHGERRPLRALGFGALAALAAPVYTLRRLARQRPWNRGAPA